MNLTAGPADPSARIEAIEGAVAVLASSRAISAGLANSLSAKLGAAGNRVHAQPPAAVGILGAFIRQVAALVQAGKLDLTEGTNLTAAAQSVITQLTD